MLLLLLYLALLFEQRTCLFNTNSFVPSAGFFDLSLANNFDLNSTKSNKVTEGKTPAKVVIDKVVSYPIAGQPDTIVLRNIGGKVADLNGWTMTDNKKSVDLKDRYQFGTPGCKENATINPMETLVLTPKTDENPCGFEFGISFRDQVNLFNREGELVSSVEWSSSEQGTALCRIADDTFITLQQQNTTVLDVLRQAGIFSTFLEALEITGLAQTLQNAADPKYDGPHLPATPPPPAIEVVFPWWFGFQVDRSTLPPPPPPPPSPPAPPMGMPSLGPYTLLAPTDKAFADLLAALGGPNNPFPKKKLLELPELKDILEYHIIYGDFTSDFLLNNTGLQTAKGPEVIISKDASQTEGTIAFNDACVDKQTPDEYTCMQQVEFSKCYDPFMISPATSNWKGGYCQKTCQRCTCSPSSNMKCSMVIAPDLTAANGVVHGINRVLFPPPVFSKEHEMKVPQVEETVTKDMDLSAFDSETKDNFSFPKLPTLPTLPQLPSLSTLSIGLPN